MALVAALSLAAACGRAPVEPPAEPTPDLPPPASSSTLFLSPRPAPSAAYTNEMQAANLLKETAAMEGPPQNPLPSLSAAERKKRRQQLRDATKQFARMRRSIDSARDKNVSLPGDTVGLIPSPDSGRALTPEMDASTAPAVKK